MIFIYLPMAAVPRMLKLPSNAAEISSRPKDNLFLSRSQLHTSDTPDATATPRDPVFGHSGAIVCGVVLAAFVGLAILGCLFVRRQTLCYKRRGMCLRYWKKLRRTKNKDTERANPGPDPDPEPEPEAAPLVQYQRGFFSICMGRQTQTQAQRIATSTHPVRVIAVVAPSTARSLPKSLPPTVSPLPSSTQGSTFKITTTTKERQMTMATPSRGLPRPLRPLIRPSALWPPPAPGYSTYPSSKRRYDLNTDPTTRVITPTTRPRCPAPQAILPSTVSIQSCSVFSSDSRWIGRLFRERRASTDGTHISNYFRQNSPNAHDPPSESSKPMAVVVAEKMCSSDHGHGGDDRGAGNGTAAAATTSQETAADLTRRIRRSGGRHKIVRAREITKIVRRS